MQLSPAECWANTILDLSEISGMAHKDPTCRPRIGPGFTLVELLVTITLIVILIAMLAPAMDRAVYEAELAVCATNLRAIAGGVTTYAAGNERRYPARDGRRNLLDWYPFGLASYDSGGRYFDERPSLAKALDINGMLNDPAAGKVDLTTKINPYVYTAYSMWFEWEYGSEAGMYKLGDRWSWGGVDFNVLAGDHDRLDVPPGTSPTGGSLASHPDEQGVLSRFKSEASSVTLARWQNLTALRGDVNLNFGFTDGSVQRYNRVGLEDERMMQVPDRADAGQQQYWWDTVPRQ